MVRLPRSRRQQMVDAQTTLHRLKDGRDVGLGSRAGCLLFFRFHVFNDAQSVPQ